MTLRSEVERIVFQFCDGTFGPIEEWWIVEGRHAVAMADAIEASLAAVTADRDRLREALVGTLNHLPLQERYLVLEALGKRIPDAS